MDSRSAANFTVNLDRGPDFLGALAHIAQAIEGALGLGLTWLEYIQGIEQPAILINATEPYGSSGHPILPEELARETVALMKHCTYHHVSGKL